MAREYNIIWCKTIGLKIQALKKEDVEIVINHVFFNKYDIYEDGIFRNFDPSYEMSVCFQRMVSRQKLKNIDKILFNHELMETKLMKEELRFSEAHSLAQEKYNFSEKVKAWQRGDFID